MQGSRIRSHDFGLGVQCLGCIFQGPGITVEAHLLGGSRDLLLDEGVDLVRDERSLLLCVFHLSTQLASNEILQLLRGVSSIAPTPGKTVGRAPTRKVTESLLDLAVVSLRIPLRLLLLLVHSQA